LQVPLLERSGGPLCQNAWSCRIERGVRHPGAPCEAAPHGVARFCGAGIMRMRIWLGKNSCLDGDFSAVDQSSIVIRKEAEPEVTA
jgi:hypothetical protein